MVLKARPRLWKPCARAQPYKCTSTNRMHQTLTWPCPQLASIGVAPLASVELHADVLRWESDPCLHAQIRQLYVWTSIGKYNCSFAYVNTECCACNVCACILIVLFLWKTFKTYPGPWVIFCFIEIRLWSSHISTRTYLLWIDLPVLPQPGFLPLSFSACGRSRLGAQI